MSTGAERSPKAPGAAPARPGPHRAGAAAGAAAGQPETQGHVATEVAHAPLAAAAQRSLQSPEHAAQQRAQPPEPEAIAAVVAVATHSEPQGHAALTAPKQANLQSPEQAAHLNAPPTEQAAATAEPLNSPVLLQTTSELFRAIDATRFVFRGMPLAAGRQIPAVAADAAAAAHRAPAANETNMQDPTGLGFPGVMRTAAPPTGAIELYSTDPNPAHVAADLATEQPPRARSPTGAADAPDWRRGGGIFASLTPPDSPLPEIALAQPPLPLAPAAPGSAFRVVSQPEGGPRPAEGGLPGGTLLPRGPLFPGAQLIAAMRPATHLPHPAAAGLGRGKAWWPWHAAPGVGALDAGGLHGSGSCAAAAGVPHPGQAFGMGLSSRAAPLQGGVGEGLVREALRAHAAAQGVRQGSCQGPGAGQVPQGLHAAPQGVPAAGGGLYAFGKGTQFNMLAGRVRITTSTRPRFHFIKPSSDSRVRTLHPQAHALRAGV